MNAKWVAGFVIRRILSAIPMVLAVIIVNFLLIQAAPGDPATVLVGDYPAPPEYLDQIRAQYGLDKPVWEQLWLYLVQVFQGNLGMSFSQRQPVLDLLLERLVATLQLTLTALALAVVIGVLLGVIGARFRGSGVDSGTQGFTLLGYSIPEFWLGQMLIVVFAVQLGLLPTGGAGPVRVADPTLARMVPYLILPASALSFRYISIIGRMTRSSLLEVNNADFVTAARSRGLTDGQVLRRHTLRNASPPIVTVIGYNLGFVLAGSIMVETVFSWPGIGRLMYDAIGARDYPVLTGVLIVISITVVLANLLTDIVLALIDPRVASRD